MPSFKESLHDVRQPNGSVVAADYNQRIEMKRLAIIVQAAACLLLAGGMTAQAEEKKGDVTGTWTWTTEGRQGGPGRETTLKLKQEGTAVTGTISGWRRGGDSGQANDIKIEQGKVEGDQVSFVVTREFQGNSFSTKYHGKVAGDTITGKISMQGRDGQARERDWVAKRAKGEKKDS